MFVAKIARIMRVTITDIPIVVLPFAMKLILTLVEMDT
jgi:hypothetical protein